MLRVMVALGVASVVSGLAGSYVHSCWSPLCAGLEGGMGSGGDRLTDRRTAGLEGPLRQSVGGTV